MKDSGQSFGGGVLYALWGCIHCKRQKVHQVFVSCAIKRAFVVTIDDRYRAAGAESEHVQHQILPL